MQLSLKQKEFWNNATHRWNVKEGATRSGKTYLDYYMIPRRIRAANNGGLIALIGNTKSTLQRNIIEPMQSIWTTGLVGDIKNDNTCYMFGRKVYALGADKVSQVSKIQGAGFEYVYGDEITTWNKEVFEMLKSRLSYPNSVFDGTCNPDAPTHWFKEFLESGSDIYRQSYTIDDNPFLDPRVREEIKRDYEGTVYYDRFVLGLWARAEGLIYPQFDKNKHVTNVCPEEGVMYMSIDYGTKNPFSAGLWCISEGKAVRIAEFYYDSRKEKRQKTDEEYYEKIEKLAADKKIADIIVDPSAASFIETIHRHGKFRVRKARNEVLDGIRNTSRLLSAGRLLIHESCKDSQREFQSYAWDESAATDTVIKENDHAMDDTRYFVQTVLCGVYRW